MWAHVGALATRKPIKLAMKIKVNENRLRHWMLELNQMQRHQHGIPHSTRVA
jgi:hypothetical protein